jgi:hypothetical protein
MLRRCSTKASAAAVCRRALSANARYELPAFAGEPFKHYAPGSPEAVSLTNELTRAKAEVCQISFPLILVDGDRLWKSPASLVGKNTSREMFKNKFVIISLQSLIH